MIMNIRKLWLTLLAAALLMGLAFAGAFNPVAAQTDDTDDDTDDTAQTQTQTQTQNQSLMAVMRNHDQLNDFVMLVQAAGLANNLDSDGPFTVFAPTDAALANIETQAVNAEATVTDILLYHIVNGRYDSSAVANRTTLPTLMGDHLNIGVGDDGIRLNNNVGLVSADIQASNGTIHIVDRLLVPSVNSIFTSGQGSPEHTLSRVLADDGRFTTFLGFLETANLNVDLNHPARDYTIFAPTDTAFANLSEELMTQLRSEPQTLRAILLYHMVGDSLSINQIANDYLIPTLEGRPLIVSKDANQRVMLNNTPLEAFNIVASNGVIHVVDNVLTP
jgi:uncharacterized surface protein with fasciclin (FAS1) repeats